MYVKCLYDETLLIYSISSENSNYLIFDILSFENAGVPWNIPLMRGDNHLLKMCFIPDSLDSRSFATCYRIQVVVTTLSWGREGDECIDAKKKSNNVHREPWILKTLTTELLSSEVCKVWHWYCSALKVYTQFQKIHTTKVLFDFFPNLFQYQHVYWKFLGATKCHLFPY